MAFMSNHVDVSDDGDDRADDGHVGRRLASVEVSTFAALSTAVLRNDVHVTVLTDYLKFHAPVTIGQYTGVTISGHRYHQRGTDDTTLTVLNGSMEGRVCLFFF